MVVTISMVLAVPVMLLHERAARAVDRARRSQRDYDRIDAPPAPVIIAGYGRFGQIVSRVLRMCGIPFTALEANYAQVDFVRRFGNRIYYGDASRLELLQAAKAGDAKLFVLAIDDVEASVKTRARRAQAFSATSRSSRARATAFTTSACAISACARSTARRFPASLDVAHQALLQARFRRRGRAARRDALQAARRGAAARRSTPCTTTKRSSSRPRSRPRRSCSELFEADVRAAARASLPARRRKRT